MECREACKVMTDFLEGTYPVSRQEEFIWHVENCAACKEELKVCLTLQMALNALDDNTEFIYMDSDEGLKTVLENAQAKVARYNQYRQIKAAFFTAAGWALTAVIGLQILYWIQTGFWIFKIF